MKADKDRQGKIQREKNLKFKERERKIQKGGERERERNNLVWILIIEVIK